MMHEYATAAIMSAMGKFGGNFTVLQMVIEVMANFASASDEGRLEELEAAAAGLSSVKDKHGALEGTPQKAMFAEGGVRAILDSMSEESSPPPLVIDAI